MIPRLYLNEQRVRSLEIIWVQGQTADGDDFLDMLDSADLLTTDYDEIRVNCYSGIIHVYFIRQDKIAKERHISPDSIIEIELEAETNAA